MFEIRTNEVISICDMIPESGFEGRIRIHSGGRENGLSLKSRPQFSTRILKMNLFFVSKLS